MDSRLRRLADEYRSRRTDDTDARQQVHELRERYIRERRQGLFDAVVAAVSLGAVFHESGLNLSDIDPQMEEAFELAFPGRDLASLADYAPDQIPGVLSNWKGKYFEVLVRDRLNSGEWVGDISLGPGQTAHLASDLTQPGWDIQILSENGSVVEDLQLKATDSLSYVKEALVSNPDIDVIATDEVAEAGHAVLEGLHGSGVTVESLEEGIGEAIEVAADSGVLSFLDIVAPGVPFFWIGGSELRKVQKGEKSFTEAIDGTMKRSTKSGVAMAVGYAVGIAGGGLLAVPAGLATRLAIERAGTMKDLAASVRERTTELAALAEQYR